MWQVGRSLSRVACEDERMENVKLKMKNWGQEGAEYEGTVRAGGLAKLAKNAGFCQKSPSLTSAFVRLCSQKKKLRRF